MGVNARLASIASGAAIFILLIILYTSAPPSWTLHKARPGSVRGHNPYTGSPDPIPWNPPSPKPTSETQSAERLIVKVRRDNEDASWLSNLKPTWQNDIITIKSMFSHAHFQAHRPDKGRVASAYLTWLIENYNTLPETLIFLPPSDPFAPETLNLQTTIPTLKTSFIQTSGFANLHCPTSKSHTTCNNKALNPNRPSYELRTLEAKIPDVWRECFGQVAQVPERVASVLGAEFAVSRDQVRKRSVDEYLKMWTWLNKTIMDDDSSGLVLEYLWHVVFGKDAVFCPEGKRCACEIYEKC